MFPKVVATVESLAVLCRNSEKKDNLVKTIIFSNKLSDLTKKNDWRKFVCARN